MDEAGGGGDAEAAVGDGADGEGAALTNPDVSGVVNAPKEPFEDTKSDLPSVADLDNKQMFAPSAVARLSNLDLRNHQEWVDKLQDASFPKKMVVMLAGAISQKPLSCGCLW